MDNDQIIERAKHLRKRILTAEDRPLRAVASPDAVPEEIKSLRRWVCWKWHRSKGKWTKKPVQPDGSPASSTGEDTWSTFDAAIGACETNDALAGVGFVFGDGYSGVDLDNCKVGNQITDTARNLVKSIGSYAEVSPTGTGLKVLFKGAKPEGWSNSEEVEIYDSGRYFTVTGQWLPATPTELQPCSWEFLSKPELSEEYQHAINSMRKIPTSKAESDGSERLIKYAAQVVRCGLDGEEGLEAIQQMIEERPMPKDWTPDEILQRIDQAQRRRNKEFKSSRLTLADLQKSFPTRAPELIEGVLRKGELMTFIAASKEGKSWMSYGLAMSVAMGLPWLGHKCHQGRVLIIDNELQPSELSFRLQTVADKLFIDPADIGDRLIVEPLRGQWPNIGAIDEMLHRNYAKEELALVIVDAYYRTLPSGMSENDNAAVTEIFNRLDKIASRHKCSIALVHHASKGDQSGKSITDVGSGAGAMTRAADTHVVLRPHEQDSHAVMEAVCRSHAQPEAKTLRFEFPLWHREDGILPAVRVPKNGADRKQELRDQEADEDVLGCLREEVEATKRTIREKTGMSADRVNRSLRRLENQDRVQITKEIKVRGNKTELWAILDPISTEQS